jgi:ribosomal-protein-alanine N-acetyltransferase
MEHKGTQIIETPRLLLRKAQMVDAEPMFRNWASDPEVTKFLTWPTYQSIDNAYYILDLWIKEYEKPDFYQWMIVLKEMEEPIGSISVVHLRDDIAAAEIGYCIGQNWWHRGIMPEAVQAVIQWLFKEAGLDFVLISHYEWNYQSQRVIQKCGGEPIKTTVHETRFGTREKTVENIIRK